MHLSQVLAAVTGIPHMSPERGREIYEFVRREGVKSVLELGFAHGVSACYIGAALEENGSGHLTTIDVLAARERHPSIEELLDATGLLDWVNPIYTPTSYTWELMRMLEGQQRGRWMFDFAFIDGAHSWFVDGFAFYLVDKLLKPGGWILFDDLDWTYATSPTLGGTDFVRSMPEDERDTPQIGKVFDLLVRTHPGYDEFRTDGAWGWARKTLS
jgi:predicted O-methyltransferase YrrM